MLIGRPGCAKRPSGFGFGRMASAIGSILPARCLASEIASKQTSTDRIAAAHTASAMQPAQVRFQRPPVPLKRVTDNGAMSMRQNAAGAAPIA